jgi:hypothetical protein
MNKQWIKIIAAAVCAACVTSTHLAAADPAPAPGQSARKPSGHSYPFRGTVESIDVTAKTIHLDGKKAERVLQVTDQTTLEKDGKPAKLEEIAAGDYAKGLVSKPDGNREILVKGTFGPKPPRNGGKKTAQTKEPAKPATETVADIKPSNR